MGTGKLYLLEELSAVQIGNCRDYKANTGPTKSRNLQISRAMKQEYGNSSSNPNLSIEEKFKLP